MKKILIMLKHLSLGGAEKMFLRILDTIDLNQFELHIKLVFEERLPDISLPANINISSIFNCKTDSAKELIKNCPKKVYAENISEKYDVEIAFLEGYPTQLISASSNSSSIKIAFIHTDFRFFHHSLNAFKNSESEYCCYQKYAKLIFVSRSALDGFNKTYPLLYQKTKHIFYPPLTENMLPLYKKTCTPNTKPYLITLTRLAPEKGLFKFIEALKRLYVMGYDFYVKILGSGPLYQTLLDQIKQEHLENYISLMGYYSMPYYELKNSLAYICPSDNESFGLAIQEALFLKVPVIACRCPGTEEILHDGDFGLLVDNSADGLFLGISQFLSDSSLRQRLMENSCKGKNHWQNIFNSSSDFIKVCLPNTNV